MNKLLLLTIPSSLLLLVCTFTAADNDMLQDFCVADLTSSTKVNGFACKPASEVNPNDFSSMGIAEAGSTNNRMGFSVKAVTVQNLPGLNTMGISMSRADFAPGGISPLHAHPRATEMAFVVQGELEVGFITTANKLFSRTVTKGEVFVFPRGLIHFLKNIGHGPASILSGLNSQLPGIQSAGPALFAADPAIPDDVLSKNFKLEIEEIQKMKQDFARNK